MRNIVELFSHNVRELCHQQGLTAKDLSQKTDIRIETIKAIWEGKHDADLEQVGQIAAALQIAPHILLMDIKEK